nr:DUF1629 domain-containing protein [Pseudomonas quercus]
MKYIPDDEGAPYFFELNWVPDIPVFHYPTESPVQADLCESYQAIAHVAKITADWLPDHFLVSKKFLEICEKLNCSYVCRPVELIIKGKASGLEYFFFIASQRLMAMDLENSKFTIDQNPKIEEQRLNGPSYEKIEKLSIIAGVNSDLFYFEEIKEVVCSSFFRDQCLDKKVSGLDFVKIDDSYQYSPWDDF